VDELTGNDHRIFHPRFNIANGISDKKRSAGGG
jgi:hypothetical protein